jgi:hypothetical protein
MLERDFLIQNLEINSTITDLLKKKRIPRKNNKNSHNTIQPTSKIKQSRNTENILL